MHDYKFRGKKIFDGQWAYGSLLQSEIAGNGHVKCAIGERFADCYDIGLHEVEPGTVGMWSGFTDKAGKEIYKDDIVFDEIPHIVRFGEYEQDGFVHTGFYLQHVSSGLVGGFSEEDAKYLTVIGNIHDEENAALTTEGNLNMNTNFDPGTKQVEEQEQQPAEAVKETEMQIEQLPDQETEG